MHYFRETKRITSSQEPLSLIELEKNILLSVDDLIDAAIRFDQQSFTESLIACDNGFDAFRDEASKQHALKQDATASEKKPLRLSTLAKNITEKVFDRLEVIQRVAFDHSDYRKESDPSYQVALEAAAFIDEVCIDRNQLSREDDRPMPAYHDAGHYLCVALGSMATSLADVLRYQSTSVLTIDDVGTSFVVGFLHDVMNTGGRNRLTAEVYRFLFLERPTWDFSEKTFSLSAKYTTEEFLRIRTVIFATDPEGGAPLADMALRFHYAEDDAAKKQILEESHLHVKRMLKQLGSREEKIELINLRKSLFADRKTAVMACILGRNDTTLSVQTVESHDKNTREFDRELKSYGINMNLMTDQDAVNPVTAGLFFIHGAHLKNACPDPTLEHLHREPGARTMFTVTGIMAEPGKAVRTELRENPVIPPSLKAPSPQFRTNEL